MLTVSRLSLLTASLLLASQAYSFDFMKDSDLVFQLGAYFADIGESQYIDNTDMTTTHYSADAGSTSSALLGLGYYLPGVNNDTFTLDYGINAYYLFATTAKGDFAEDVPGGMTGEYSYNISHVPVYAAAKLNFKNPTKTCAFTMDVGIGPNFMTTRNYEDNDAFSGETTTSFSATGGIGLRFYQLVGPLDFEAGYRFFYLGQGSLSKEGYLIEDDLNTGDITASALVFALTL